MRMSRERTSLRFDLCAVKSGNGVTIGSAVDAGYGRTTAAWASPGGGHLAAAGPRGLGGGAMSVVTEHLEQRGSVFEVIPHRQAYTSVDEARALGIEVGEVLKTLAVRTGSGYALMVIPASHRLDLHLAREALGDSRARLASEEELGRDFPDYELGALPPLGALLDAQVYVDPEVLGHDTVTFAAGSQTESVKMQTQELFGSGGFTTMSLVKRPERGSDDRIW
jgi:Ala-tRNA(Pro) deacylase